jgi:hypothetical protein
MTLTTVLLKFDVDVGIDLMQFYFRVMMLTLSIIQVNSTA